MCTALNYHSGGHYFGRTLDLAYSYNEHVVIMPRNFPILYRKKPVKSEHQAIIGMATITDDYPLYYDATNESGLSMAALNFPGNAKYFDEQHGKDNIAPFEMIQWVLSQCTNISEAEALLKHLNITATPYSAEFPLTPLHWIISSPERSVTVEQTNDGLHIYHNPTGILTNNPSFEYQLHNLQNYANLTNKDPEVLSQPYSNGLGAIGLPGDFSSSSRFVRANFIKEHSCALDKADHALTQFFHILSSVNQPEGVVKTKDGFVKTIYTSCCDTAKGIYYYTTYGNRQITAVNMQHEDLRGQALVAYSLRHLQEIYEQN